LRQIQDRAEVAYSTYGENIEPGSHHYRGGKWAGLFDFFVKQPDLLERYEYFWFPDDDICTTGDAAAAFLSLCHLRNFEIAQPALTPDSYFAYRETIQSPLFEYRRTNLVELMMPCMRRSFLRKILPLFEGRHAALGLDWVWQNSADRPQTNVAIVDAYPMRHSRPRNTHLATKMRGQNISIADERANTFEALSIQPLTPVVYGGMLKNGRNARNNTYIALNLFAGYLSVQKNITNGKWTMKHSLKLALKQLTSRHPK